MLRINKNIEVCAFEDFKRVVKGTLGLQMFKSSEYSIRQAAHSNDIFTVRFAPSTHLSESSLKMAWVMIYKDCLSYGLCDEWYAIDVIPTPCIDNRTLIFRITYIKNEI